ncbi:MAG TPA: hypothetical protein VM077_02195 [Candidatus Limnocylindrales bacterium]|nr:hypothetical protein [Candidatus Limnocylindrales bacterium]
MNRRLYILIPLVILVSTAFAFGGISIYKKFTTPQPVHFHAGFQLYIDGKLQDFSGAKYMKEDPCTVDDSEHGIMDEQLEKAHLHDRTGIVVHSHRKNVLWSDLFTNIKYKIPNDKEIKSFVNGKEVKEILNNEINPYDSVVIILGDDKKVQELLKKAVTKDQIIKEEKKSESCGS